MLDGSELERSLTYLTNGITMKKAFGFRPRFSLETVSFLCDGKYSTGNHLML